MTNKELRLSTYFMKSALLSAQNSWSNRKKVGAVLVRDGRIIANSWNGTPTGFPNSCETEKDGVLVTVPEVIHAEANIILFCAKNGISTKDADIYVTLSPCMQCALMLIQSGIKRVFYNEEYRIAEPIDILRNNNIDVIKFTV